MRRIIGIAGLSLLVLTGCISKKKTTYANKSGKAEKSSKAKEKSSEKAAEAADTFVFIEVDSPEEYIRTFAPLAQSEMRTHGIPASIKLAQGLLESGFGRGELARKTNNHFGIKCHVGWEGDYERHDDDERDECFRRYNHPMYSYRDHSLFLTTRSRYGSLFDLPQDNYKAWARGLKKAGYATDRRYPEKLIELIERYDLDQYDAEVLGKRYKSGRNTSLSGYNSYRVQEGDTLYAISRRHYVSVEELMRLNGLKSNEISVGQVLKVPSQKVK
ncbi:glucosaminidase domain-containing protein [Robiginitalea aurantiaca]|uniref:Peptidoglycan hydrolase n=1 Tax=Robiginitalea aurantiaca TaxID=3056915 RepID=A0ABT7WF90_9FLAO|nr:glucosaminidase domain-containing protein [Robiginitalea aurantiaca]MDM9631586.1 glucosaminidase domain-containing protein [Robiginitalea aurantiaca]